MMKPYKQTQELFSMVGDFHRRLSELYEDMTEKAERDGVKEFLQHLRRHEKRMHQGLEAFAAGESHELGETWVQFVPEDDPLGLSDLETLALSPEMNVQEWVAFSMEWHGRLTDFYSAMAENPALAPKVRDMFGKLKEQQEQETGKIRQIAEQL
jgi:hypothetical protein